MLPFEIPSSPRLFRPQLLPLLLAFPLPLAFFPPQTVLTLINFGKLIHHYQTYFPPRLLQPQSLPLLLALFLIFRLGSTSLKVIIDKQMALHLLTLVETWSLTYLQSYQGSPPLVKEPLPPLAR